MAAPLPRLNDLPTKWFPFSWLRATEPGVGTQRLTLPVPPSANRYWRVFRGRAVKSQEARDYQKLVWVTARQQKARIIRAAEIAISVQWTRKAKRGDLDNRLKCLLDALKGLAWSDDRQIREIHAMRTEGAVDSILVSWWEAA